MTYGTIISPLEASMILRGLRTLELRVKRCNDTAMKLAAYLNDHPKVRKVYHPLLPSSPNFELAQKQMSGNGGLFSLLLDTEDLSKLESFCKSLKRILIGVSWGGHESLYIPFYAFHGKPDAKASMPINFFRFYIGLEDYEYLKSDIDNALAQI